MNERSQGRPQPVEAIVPVHRIKAVSSEDSAKDAQPENNGQDDENTECDSDAKEDCRVPEQQRWSNRLIPSGAPSCQQEQNDCRVERPGPQSNGIADCEPRIRSARHCIVEVDKVSPMAEAIHVLFDVLMGTKLDVVDPRTQIRRDPSSVGITSDPEQAALFPTSHRNDAHGGTLSSNRKRRREILFGRPQSDLEQNSATQEYCRNGQAKNE